MGFMVSIVSVILKSVAEDKIEDGLFKDVFKILLNEGSEKGVKEITDFVNRSKSSIDNMISPKNLKSLGIPEEKTTYIEADIKDLLSEMTVTDEVLSKCRYDGGILGTFLWDEYRKSKKEDIEYESGIKRCLSSVAEAIVELARKSEDFEKNVLIHASGSIDDVNAKLQKMFEYLDKNFEKLLTNDRSIIEGMLTLLNQDQGRFEDNQNKKPTPKSRTEEYAKKWDENMFLNDFDKRDKNAGVNVKLGDVYRNIFLPHYNWCDDKKYPFNHNEKDTYNDLDELLSEYIVENKDSKMLLVFGQPGIGKSTLITWIAANFNHVIDKILVYKFASDLKTVDWEHGRTSENILEEIGLKCEDLKDKILILDGFDEINIESNGRRNILDSLYGDWIFNKRISGFSLIITCRENYVQQFAILKCKHITLQPWDGSQIICFCKIFQEKTEKNVSEDTIRNLMENKEILGIPLILYMVLALNISVENGGSIVDVYDKIFAIDGGIYDRCINYKSFAGPHRIGEIKKQIHQISRGIAMWMFENNPEEAYIPQEEYRKICNNVSLSQHNSEIIEQDFLIGNFFRLVKYCEGIETERLYFVHRTIYEYFVSETIFTSVYEKIDVSIEELAGIFGKLLKKGNLTQNILDYLGHKITNSKLNNMFDAIDDAFQLMLQDGMTYYAKESYKNIIKCEMRVFVNMLEFLHLWKENIVKLRLSNPVYLKYEADCPFNLSHINLKGTDLSGSKLRYANLKCTDLKGAKMKNADLRHADLRGAILPESDFQTVYLDNILLEGAVLSEKQVEYLKSKANLYDVKVYIDKTQEIISYEEYQKRYKRSYAY